MQPDNLGLSKQAMGGAVDFAYESLAKNGYAFPPTLRAEGIVDEAVADAVRSLLASGELVTKEESRNSISMAVTMGEEVLGERAARAERALAECREALEEIVRRWQANRDHYVYFGTKAARDIALAALARLGSE